MDYVVNSFQATKWKCAACCTMGVQCCTMEFQIKCSTEKAFAFKFIFLDLFLKYIVCFLKKTVERLDHNVFKAVGFAALCSGFN